MTGFSLSGVSRVEIDTDALIHNYHHLSRIVGEGTEVSAVVKADAYGHGLITASRAFYSAGCRSFCIAEIEEAYALRKEFGPEIRILRVVPSLPQEFEPTYSLGIEEVIASSDQIRAWKDWLAPRGRSLPVHFKIDRGMGRLGFSYAEHNQGWQLLLSDPSFSLVGLMSHLPASEEDSAVDSNIAGHSGYHTIREVDRFQGLVEDLERQAGRSLEKHLANSGGALFYPEGHFDRVRIGLALYGADPRGESGLARGLRPAMSVRTHLVQVRMIPAGATIGYGREFLASDPMKVGVIPIGYSNGFFRSAAKKAAVLVAGKRCALLGRISMNLITLDLEGVPEARWGDPVTVLGEDGGDRILVEEMAKWAGTIPYEIFTSMGRLAPRVG